MKITSSSYLAPAPENRRCLREGSEDGLSYGCTANLDRSFLSAYALLLSHFMQTLKLLGFARPSFQAPRRQFGSNLRRGRQVTSVQPLRQSNSVSCGQTSVAMALNSLTGSRLTDKDVARSHGFRLLEALNSGSNRSGYHWKDGGNFRARDWPLLERKLNMEKTPVLMGLNGAEFSTSGRGHIVTLLSLEGNRVRYADPADGKIKFTTRQRIESAPPHPDGKFFFYADRLGRGAG